MHIDIWSDVACPWCYLGVRHLRKALREFPHRDSVTVRIHAYLLDPELDASIPEMSEAQYLAQTKKIPVDDVASILESLSDMGRSEGIKFAWNDTVVAPTSNAHRLICLAREIDIENDAISGPDTLQMRVHEGLQRARFEMGIDLAHPESLIALARDFSIPGERVLAALESQEYASEVFSDFQIGVQMGVTAVPVFVFDRTFQMSGAQTSTAYSNALVTAWNHAHPDQPISVMKDDDHE
ncbi:MAG: DsbA family oxidoreductase [Actinomycetaceae bacterium]|nr:DsbA family oxidoreductase [Actinomycetaceae bacterium]